MLEDTYCVVNMENYNQFYIAFASEEDAQTFLDLAGYLKGNNHNFTIENMVVLESRIVSENSVEEMRNLLLEAEKNETDDILDSIDEIYENILEEFSYEMKIDDEYDDENDLDEYDDENDYDDE